ncbi:regulator of RNase E activity RraA [Sporomusaceae bacterium BoRhaA]|uniref:RraA family protein n=1 Tax=Pelorhabdus rhamnosifermentans TaxID=2772457 RepID=UPI001C0609C9|nr:RraA family protein [Pelorhabdus rhamnosifermentans]MBU2699989.1 regulator of RNase E activity RraA [Pelorhabdus rhamnosifermentans]
MTNTGFRIYTKFNRPSRSVVEGFRGIPVANIDDCMNRSACIDAKIRPLNKAPLLGTAFTVKARPGDNLLLYKAIEMAQTGDVVVVAVQGELSNAVTGQLMITRAKQRGIAGLVIDGAVRDSDAIKNMDIPVYAVGTTSNGPYKEGPGEINVPVALGGIVVNPGDILVGDADSVVVINPREAADIMERAKAVVAKELGIMKAIESNSWDISWVDKMLKEKGCEFIEAAWDDRGY